MLIILEGVDGAGKSGLANALVQALEEKYPDSTVTYLHAGPITSGTYEAYIEPLEDYDPKKTDQHIVIDRWHVGEQIYGPLYRGGSRFDDVMYHHTEMYLAAKGAVLFNVTQTLDVLRDRLAVRGEDFLQDKDVDHVRKEFERLTPKSMLFSEHVRPDDSNRQEYVEYIITDAEWVASRARRLAKLGVNYSGRTAVDPRTVLVHSSSKSAKSMELLDKFWSAVPGEFKNSTGIIRTGSESKLRKFVDEFPFVALIAYDKNIIKKLDKLEIEYEAIDEPKELGVAYSRHLSIQIEKAGEV